MKKLILTVMLILTITIWTVIVQAEDYKYLNKTIIEKLDKKIDSIKWNKTKSLMLLISKVDKIIKKETNATKKSIYTELKEYLIIKKNELDKLWQYIDVKSNDKEYVDTELWILFLYQEELWTIKKEYEYWENWLATVQLSINNQIILWVSNWNIRPWRWAYWGDESYNINSEEYINNLCKNTKLDKEKNEKCELLKNKKWITYVKKTLNRCLYDEGCNNNLIEFYYFYNPDSTFRGLVLSNERLNTSIDNFSTIIESLEFIKNVSKNEKNLWNWYTLNQSDDNTNIVYNNKTIYSFSHKSDKLPFIWDEWCDLLTNKFLEVWNEWVWDWKQKIWESLSKDEQKQCLKQNYYKNVSIELISSGFFTINRAKYESVEKYLYDWWNDKIYKLSISADQIGKIEKWLSWIYIYWKWNRWNDWWVLYITNEWVQKILFRNTDLDTSEDGYIEVYDFELMVNKKIKIYYKWKSLKLMEKIIEL